MIKHQFLPNTRNEMKKDHAEKLFNKLHYNQTCFDFFQMRKIPATKMVNSLDNRWLDLTPQDIPIMMKNKPPIHILMFRVVTIIGDVITPFVFLHSLRLNTDTCVKFLKEVVLALIKRVTDGTLHNPTQTREPGVGRQKISATTLRESLNKFPDFFCMGTFIDSTHMKLYSHSK